MNYEAILWIYQCEANIWKITERVWKITEKKISCFQSSFAEVLKKRFSTSIGLLILVILVGLLWTVFGEQDFLDILLSPDHEDSGCVHDAS